MSPLDKEAPLAWMDGEGSVSASRCGVSIDGVKVFQFMERVALESHD